MENEEKKVEGSAADKPQIPAESAVEDAGEKPLKKEKSPKTGEKKAKKEQKKIDPETKKRVLAVGICIGVVILLLITLLVVNAIRSRRPPDLESVREQVEMLIEASLPLNEVLFGDGLETYPRVYEQRIPVKIQFKGEEHTLYYYTYEDERYGTVVAYQGYVRVKEEGTDNYTFYDVEPGGLADKNTDYRFVIKTDEPRDEYVYAANGYYYYRVENFEKPVFFYTETDDEYYDYVVNTSPYQHTDDIKAKAGQIYSSGYLASIYESLFTGVTVSNQAGGTLYARYRDYEEDGYYYLQECNQVKGYDLPERRYDYSTMKMASGSNARYIVIEIETYVAGNEQDRQTAQISFVLENGNWYLDTPTY